MKMNPGQSSVHPREIEKYPFLFHTTFELQEDEIGSSSDEIFKKRRCELLQKARPGETWYQLRSRFEPILETEEESPQPIQDIGVIQDLPHAHTHHKQPKEGSSSGSSGRGSRGGSGSRGSSSGGRGGQFS